MKWWSVGAFAAGIALLAAAKYVDSPVWINLLVGSGAGFGLGVALALTAVLRRRSRIQHDGPLYSSLVLAIAAVATRGALLAQIGDGVRPEISLWQLLLAGASVAWGAVGLAIGTSEISSFFSNQDRRYFKLLLAAVAVSLCLFAVAPLWRAVGLNINHWTFLGLFGIAAFFYAFSAGYAWLAAFLFDREKRGRD